MSFSRIAPVSPMLRFSLESQLFHQCYGIGKTGAILEKDVALVKQL
jgi:hypothetical protein